MQISSFQCFWHLSTEYQTETFDKNFHFRGLINEPSKNKKLIRVRYDCFGKPMQECDLAGLDDKMSDLKIRQIIRN